jgi:hypothetical protein
LTSLRKTFCTHAYRVKKEDGEHILFWAIITSGLDPEKAFVTEHDLYGGHASSRPIADQMPHSEAFKRIVEIERDAAAKYPLAGEEAFDHPSVKWCRPDMAPWQEHPMYQKEIKDEALRRLRAKKPPGFGLK